MKALTARWAGGDVLPVPRATTALVKDEKCWEKTSLQGCVRSLGRNIPGKLLQSQPDAPALGEKMFFAMLDCSDAVLQVRKKEKKKRKKSPPCCRTHLGERGEEPSQNIRSFALCDLFGLTDCREMNVTSGVPGTRRLIARHSR